MNILGDLERVFATSLYPLRIPIAIGLSIALIGLLVAARRRGWFAAARHHPRRTVVVGAVILAFALPTAFYLGSPLFVRTELIEPSPVAIAGSTATSPPITAPPEASSSGSLAPTDPISSLAAEPTPFVPAVLAAGPFKGADEFHFGEGTASIIETAPGRYTLHFEDFSVRNGPDLFVYLSSDAAGYADGALELGTLKATDGTFGYELPEGSDPTDFASAVIWCKQFAVQFAVAPLAAT
jgi:hypothetical protein